MNKFVHELRKEEVLENNDTNREGASRAKRTSDLPRQENEKERTKEIDDRAADTWRVVGRKDTIRCWLSVRLCSVEKF